MGSQSVYIFITVKYKSGRQVHRKRLNKTWKICEMFYQRSLSENYNTSYLKYSASYLNVYSDDVTCMSMHLASNIVRSQSEILKYTSCKTALRYKPEGRGIDSQWCHWRFSLIYSFRPHYGPGVDSGSNGNEYYEYFLGVKATGA
jgi:hypothetical protein